MKKEVNKIDAIKSILGFLVLLVAYMLDTPYQIFLLITYVVAGFIFYTVISEKISAYIFFYCFFIMLFFIFCREYRWAEITARYAVFFLVLTVAIQLYNYIIITFKKNHENKQRI